MQTEAAAKIAGILEHTPDVWAVTITARNMDRNKYLRLDIMRTMASPRMSRPSSEHVGVTITAIERPDNISHLIESDWITLDEVNAIVKSVAGQFDALDIKRTDDEAIFETRWIFKPYKLWPQKYKDAIERKK